MSSDTSKIVKNTSTAFVKSMKRRSKIQDISETGIVILNYDQECYPFESVMIENLIEKKLIDHEVSLDKLHQNLMPADMEVDADGNNAVLKALYETNNVMSILYSKFMKEIILPFIGENCYVQKTPTNRFSFPFSKGMTDRDYHNDIMLGHPPEVVNVWVPLTNTSKSRSFSILGLSDSLNFLKKYDNNLSDLHYAIWNDDNLFAAIQKKATIVEMKPGEVMLFDSRCIHSSTLNSSEYTRVSIDVRIIALEEYLKLPFKYIGTGRRRAQFIPGDYYTLDPLSSK